MTWKKIFKNKIILLVFLCCILGAKDFKHKTPAPHRFYGHIKMGVASYTYKEPDVMSIAGPMAVFGAMGGLKINSFIKSDLEVYYATDMGKNIYDGSVVYKDGRTEPLKAPLKAPSKDYYLGGVYRAGLTILKGDNGEEYFGIYTGLGYRYLQNQVQSKAAYLREQSYVYLPFGVRISVPLSKDFVLKANGELRAMIFGNNTSHFRDIGRDNDLHFIQTSGTGVRLGGGVAFGNKNAFFIQAVFDYWSIAKSDVKPAYVGGKVDGYYVEPENNTIAYGVEIGFAF
ncbi:hypothetical protein [Helicobacter sp. 11S02596-1]|uniref:hypothetical protein n=1 Tax=Helicobacter sp. 11S02596-1 TaxID=1476194 RepID=UPI000BA670F2|nr:hypothetical protein [Helicobacter sp. 11S02596-1]PAF42476.1 hypothetical protein BJI48_06660 [Helicobacter sp. 11S02596-1]